MEKNVREHKKIRDRRVHQTPATEVATKKGVLGITTEESENLMHTFFDSPGIMRGIVEIVDDTTVRHIADNHVTASFIGLTPEALRNKLSSELGEPPETIRLWVSHYKQSLQTGKPVNFEYQDQRGDHEAWLSATVSYLRTVSGQPQFAYVVFDTTERKKTEESLKESEEKYRSLFESINEGFALCEMVYDAAGTPVDYRFILVNPALEKFVGSPNDQVVGKNVKSILPNVQQKAIELFGKVASTRKPVRFENYSINLDRWFDVFAYSPETGKFAYLLQDITERKKAEEEVRKLAASFEQERDRLSTLVNSIPDEVWFADAQKNFTLANPSALHEFGFSSANKIDVEAFARSLEVYRPDGSPRPVEEAPPLRALEGETVRNQEEIIRTPVSGELRYRQVSAAPVKDANGNIVGSVSVVRDITERKKAEQELQQTRDYLENLFNYANAPIIVWNPEFEITRFNHAFERLTGRMADEIVGKKLDILFPGDSREASMDLIRQAAAGDRWEVVEIPILNRDGVVRIVLWNSATLYTPEGKTALATIAQGQDITERKKAEEALRETRDYLDNLFNFAHAPIIVWNPEFKITRFNHAFEDLTGRTADEVMGKKLDILFPDDSCEGSMDFIRKTPVGERWDVVEIPILHRDGTVRVVLWNSAVVYAPDGKTAVATIAQGQDITERKMAEEELKRSNIELEASNKELEAFSYSVSHDLRAPLRSMEGFSNALLEDYADKLDDHGKQYLKYVQESSDLMARLIDDLLKLSRVTRSEMNYEMVNLSDLAQKILTELQKTEADRKVKLDISPYITTYGDRNLLRLALENLLGNAWKFSSKTDSPRIEMGVTMHNGKQAYFIRDNGVGFDMTYADKLFKPFQRLHKASEFAGTGIGLATVQRIIRRHGGEVWAEGKVGEGATFYFTLG